MSFGLSFEKIILIGVIAALIIGPDKLPQFAASFAQLLNKGSDLLKGARVRMRDEIGPEFDEVDWRKLDPRQYDPRRIVREAFLDDAPGSSAPTANPFAPAGAAVASGTATAVAGKTIRDAAATRVAFSAENPPPFDSEST